MLSGSGRWASFVKSVEWRATSKAFEKSRAMRWTYGSVANIVVTVWISDMRAEVVEPEGGNANWSDRFGPSGGE